MTTNLGLEPQGMGGTSRAPRLRPLLTVLALFLLAAPAHAYVGPGAGFALAPVLVGLLIAGLTFVVLLGLPFLVAFRLLFAKRPPRGRARRVVVLGLDGLDPDLVRRFMDEGRLPRFSALAAKGSFAPLTIPVPSISPSSWSCFMSGADASYHSIYDFLTRDPRTYQPVLSSARVGKARCALRLGKYRIPLGKPVVRLLRRSKPFWKVLSERGIRSSILRVPITFPPDRFRGHMLSGMCVPDLRGTQGSFSFFTTAEPDDVDEPGLGYSGDTGGVVSRVKRVGDEVRGEIVGPENSLVRDGGRLAVPFVARIDRETGGVRLEVGSEKLRLAKGVYSPWVHLAFRAGPAVKVGGLARFLVTSVEPEFGLYVTPVQIDPEKPALPISHPLLYSVYLARKHGPFATLGLAEDTWALNEGILDEAAFLAQAFCHFEERERQLMTALADTRSGCVTVVFDTPDRIQHMFYRYLVPDHPANEGRDRTEHARAIEDLHVRLDALLGRVEGKLRRGDVLLVVSDHGFCSFDRGVNLNTWLRQEGYLRIADGGEVSGAWFEGVEWEGTRAFSLGLTGLFLNRRGREAKGTVAEGEEARALREEIAEKLEALVDPRTGRRAIRRVYDAREIYDGPYRDEAPDLLIGYDRGYRNSWEGATGRVTEEVFKDNTRAWSGDHCVDPEVVPGVLFSSSRIAEEKPSMVDLAPTILDLLGVEAPAYMTGRPLLAKEEA